MVRFYLAMVMLIGSAVYANADDEVWRCAYTNAISNEPMLVQYRAVGDDLVETSPSGQTQHFKVVQNNKYGIIGILAISDAPQKDRPTVSATTVVIEKTTGDFWLTTTIGGQPGALNQPVHGSCFKP